MTRKFLMITTAIVALAVSPSVFAQGNGTAKGTPAGRGPATMTMPATTPAPAPMAGKTAEMTKPAAMSGKVSDKKMHRAALKQQKSMRGNGLRQQNAQEIQMTRTLNSDSASGRPLNKTSANTMSGPIGTQRAMVPAPKTEKGKGVSSGQANPATSNN